MAERIKYATPPIIEALCEFRFQPGQPWDWTVPGLFYGSVREDFPIKTQQNVMEMSMEAHKGEVVTPTVKGGIARMQFHPENKLRQIGVGPDLLSVHVLRPYPGWEEFKELIDRAFETYTAVAAPLGVNRIGVRYINRVDIPQAVVQLEDYFVTPPRVPGSLPQAMNSFVSRVDVACDEQTRLLLTLAATDTGQPGFLYVLLDLDVIFSVASESLPLQETLDKVNKLRELERDAFEASITDKARELFNE
jgi:uncharacterized protein (TIGR04255 family)